MTVKDEHFESIEVIEVAMTVQLNTFKKEEPRIFQKVARTIDMTQRTAMSVSEGRRTGGNVSFPAIMF